MSNPLDQSTLLQLDELAKQWAQTTIDFDTWIDELKAFEASTKAKLLENARDLITTLNETSDKLNKLKVAKAAKLNELEAQMREATIKGCKTFEGDLIINEGPPDRVYEVTYKTTFVNGSWGWNDEGLKGYSLGLPDDIRARFMSLRTQGNPSAG